MGETLRITEWVNNVLTGSPACKGETKGRIFHEPTWREVYLAERLLMCIEESGRSQDGNTGD